MAEISVFTEKASIPNNDDLKETHSEEQFQLWQLLCKKVRKLYPNPKEEWNYPGKKYGWSFRMKDKRRAILYFLPRDGYFKVAFVFGQKATNAIMESDLPETIKKNLSEARVYAEGRGVQVEVSDKKILPVIETLVKIKLRF